MDRELPEEEDASFTSLQYSLSRQRPPLLLFLYLVNCHFTASSIGVNDSNAYINPDRISCETLL